MLVKDLEKFYNNEYKQVLNNYYVDLIGNRIVNYIKYGLIYFILLFLSDILFVFNVFFRYKYFILFIYNIFVLFIYFFNVSFINQKEFKKMNQKVLSDMIYYMNGNKSFVFKKNFQLKSSVFKNMDVFNFDLLNYEGCNLLNIPYKETQILCSDVNLYIYKSFIKKEKYICGNYNLIKNIVKKTKKSVFNGIYIELSVSKKYDCYIYLVPNNINDRFLNKYIRYSGCKILLEDIIFNKKYSVYSSDQVMSRYILSINLMDKINKLDSVISNKKYIVFKDNSTVGIFIKDFSIDKILNFDIPIRRNDKIELDYLKYFYDKVGIIFSIYDILELDSDLHKIN